MKLIKYISLLLMHPKIVYSRDRYFLARTVVHLLYAWRKKKVLSHADMLMLIKYRFLYGAHTPPKWQ